MGQYKSKKYHGCKIKIVPTSFKDHECPICLEPLVFDRNKIKCGHEFHTRCLMRHKFACRKYMRQYNCPLCRKKI